MASSNVMFSLENVSKSYNTKGGIIKAVDDISLDIFEGEIFGIIGMSGAGKSTLVRLLNRLEAADRGSIFFGGRELSALSRREVNRERHSIGMIFQQFNLLTQRNVFGNVSLPMEITGVPKEQRKRNAERLISLVGLSDKKTVYPKALSGGQQQRVAIARALATDPRALLCDECTSALDPATTNEILSLLQEINKTLNITIVIITHEMRVVEQICDRVAIIENGRLAETGIVSEVFTNPKTEAAKGLVYPHDILNSFDIPHGKCLRIVFDGRSSGEAVIADLVLQTGKKVNILAANTKSVNGIAYGQMIVALPPDSGSERIIISYLNDKNVTATEVN